MSKERGEMLAPAFMFFSSAFLGRGHRVAPARLRPVLARQAFPGLRTGLRHESGTLSLDFFQLLRRVLSARDHRTADAGPLPALHSAGPPAPGERGYGEDGSASSPYSAERPANGLQHWLSPLVLAD